MFDGIKKVISTLLPKETKAVKKIFSEENINKVKDLFEKNKKTIQDTSTEIVTDTSYRLPAKGSISKTALNDLVINIPEKHLHDNRDLGVTYSLFDGYGYLSPDGSFIKLSDSDLKWYQKLSTEYDVLSSIKKNNLGTLGLVSKKISIEDIDNAINARKKEAEEFKKRLGFDPLNADGGIEVETLGNNIEKEDRIYYPETNTSIQKTPFLNPDFLRQYRPDTASIKSLFTQDGDLNAEAISSFQSRFGSLPGIETRYNKFYIDGLDHTARNKFFNSKNTNREELKEYIDFYNENKGDLNIRQSSEEIKKEFLKKKNLEIDNRNKEKFALIIYWIQNMDKLTPEQERIVRKEMKNKIGKDTDVIMKDLKDSGVLELLTSSERQISPTMKPLYDEIVVGGSDASKIYQQLVDRGIISKEQGLTPLEESTYIKIMTDRNNPFLSANKFIQNYELESLDYQEENKEKYELAKQTVEGMAYLSYRMSKGETVENAKDFIIEKLGYNPFVTLDNTKWETVGKELGSIAKYGTIESGNYFHLLNIKSQIKDAHVLLKPFYALGYGEKYVANVLDTTLAGYRSTVGTVVNAAFDTDRSVDTILNQNSTFLNYNKNLEWYTRYFNNTFSAAGDITAVVGSNALISKGFGLISKAVTGTANTISKMEKATELSSGFGKTIANMFGFKRLNKIDDIYSVLSKKEKVSMLMKNHVISALEDITQSLALDAFTNTDRSNVDTVLDLLGYFTLTRYFTNIGVGTLYKELADDVITILGKEAIGEMPTHIKEGFAFLKGMTDHEYYQYGAAIIDLGLQQANKLNIKDPKIIKAIAENAEVIKRAKDVRNSRELLMKQKLFQSPQYKHLVKITSKGELVWDIPKTKTVATFYDEAVSAYNAIKKTKTSWYNNVVSTLRNSIVKNDYALLKQRKEYAHVFYKTDKKGNILLKGGFPVLKKNNQKEIEKAATDYFEKVMKSIGLGKIEKKKTVATKGLSYDVKYSYKKSILDNFSWARAVRDYWALSKTKKYLKANRDAIGAIARTINEDIGVEPFMHFVRMYHKEYLDGTALDLSNISRAQLDDLISEFAEIGVNRRLTEYLMQTARDSGILNSSTQEYYIKKSYQDLVSENPDRFKHLTYEIWSSIVDSNVLDTLQKEALLRSYRPSKFRRGKLFFAPKGTNNAQWATTNAELDLLLGSEGTVIMYNLKGYGDELVNSNNIDLSKGPLMSGAPTTLIYNGRQNTDGTVTYKYYKSKKEMDKNDVFMSMTFDKGRLSEFDPTQVSNPQHFVFQFSKNGDFEEIDSLQFKGMRIDDISTETKLESVEAPSIENKTKEPGLKDLLRIQKALSTGDLTQSLIAKTFGPQVKIPKEILDYLNSLHQIGYPKDVVMEGLLTFVRNVRAESNLNNTMTFSHITMNNYFKDFLTGFVEEGRYISLDDKVYYVQRSGEGSLALYDSHAKKELIGELNITINGIGLTDGYHISEVKKVTVSLADDIEKQVNTLMTDFSNKSNKSILYKSKTLREDFEKLFGYTPPEYWSVNTIKDKMSEGVAGIVNSRYGKFFELTTTSVDEVNKIKRFAFTMEAYMRRGGKAIEKYQDDVAEAIRLYYNSETHKDVLNYVGDTLNKILPDPSSASIYDVIDAYLYKKFGAMPDGLKSSSIKRRENVLKALIGDLGGIDITPSETAELLSMLPKINNNISLIANEIKKEPQKFIRFLSKAYSIVENNKAYTDIVDELQSEIAAVYDAAKKRLNKSAKEKIKTAEIKKRILADDAIINSKKQNVNNALDNLISKYDVLLESDPQNYIENYSKLNQLKWTKQKLEELEKFKQTEKISSEVGESEFFKLNKVKDFVGPDIEFMEDFVMNSPIFKNATKEIISIDGTPTVVLRFGDADRNHIVNILKSVIDMEGEIAGVALNDLKTIASYGFYEGGTIDPVSLGHEYYHLVAGTSADKARLDHINKLMYESEADRIEAYAHINGYTFDLFKSQNEEAIINMAEDEIQEAFRHWKTEEFLAQRFGEYVMKRYVPKNKKVLAFFQELLERIRAIFTFQPAIDLFDDMLAGKVKVGNVSNNSTKLSKLAPRDHINQFAASLGKEIRMGNTADDILHNIGIYAQLPGGGYLVSTALKATRMGQISLLFPKTADLLEKYSDISDGALALVDFVNRSGGNIRNSSELLSNPGIRNGEKSTLVKIPGSNDSIAVQIIGDTKPGKQNIEYIYVAKNGNEYSIHREGIDHKEVMALSSRREYFTKVLVENGKDSLFTKVLNNLLNKIKKNGDGYEEIESTIRAELHTYDLGVNDIDKNVIKTLSPSEIDLAKKAWKIHSLNKTMPHGRYGGPMMDIFYDYKTSETLNVIKGIKANPDNGLNVKWSETSQKGIYSIVYSFINGRNGEVRQMGYHLAPSKDVRNEIEMLLGEPGSHEGYSEPRAYNWLSNNKSSGDGSYVDVLMSAFKDAQDGKEIERKNYRLSRVIGDTSKVYLVKNTTPEDLLSALKVKSFSPSSLALKKSSELSKSAYGNIILRFNGTEEMLSKAIGAYGDLGTPALDDLIVESNLLNKEPEEIAEIYSNFIVGRYGIDYKDIKEILKEQSPVIAQKLFKNYVSKTILNDQDSVDVLLSVRPSFYQKMNKVLNRQFDLDVYRSIRKVHNWKEDSIKFKNIDEYYEKRRMTQIGNIFDDVETLSDDTINVDVLLKDREKYPEDVKAALTVFGEILPDGKKVGYEDITNLFKIDQIADDLYPYYNGISKKEINPRDIYFISRAADPTKRNELLKTKKIKSNEIDRMVNAISIDDVSSLGITKDSLRKAVGELYLNYTNYDHYFELFLKEQGFEDVTAIYMPRKEVDDFIYRASLKDTGSVDGNRKEIQNYIKERIGRDIPVLGLFDLYESKPGLRTSRITKSEKSGGEFFGKFLANDNTDYTTKFSYPSSGIIFNSFAKDTIHGKPLGLNAVSDKYSLKQLQKDIESLYSEKDYEVQLRDIMIYKMINGKYPDYIQGGMLRTYRENFVSKIDNEINRIDQVLDDADEVSLLDDSYENILEDELRGVKKQLIKDRNASFSINNIEEDSFDQKTFLSMINDPSMWKHKEAFLQGNLSDGNLVNKLYYSTKRKVLGISDDVISTEGAYGPAVKNPVRMLRNDPSLHSEVQDSIINEIHRVDDISSLVDDLSGVGDGGPIKEKKKVPKKTKIDQISGIDESFEEWHRKLRFDDNEPEGDIIDTGYKEPKDYKQIDSWTPTEKKFPDIIYKMMSSKEGFGSYDMNQQLTNALESEYAVILSNRARSMQLLLQENVNHKKAFDERVKEIIKGFDDIATDYRHGRDLNKKYVEDVETKFHKLISYYAEQNKISPVFLRDVFDQDGFKKFTEFANNLIKDDSKYVSTIKNKELRTLLTENLRKVEDYINDQSLRISPLQRIVLAKRLLDRYNLVKNTANKPFDIAIKEIDNLYYTEYNAVLLHKMKEQMDDFNKAIDGLQSNQAYDSSLIKDAIKKWEDNVNGVIDLFASDKIQAISKRSRIDKRKALILHDYAKNMLGFLEEGGALQRVLKKAGEKGAANYIANKLEIVEDLIKTNKDIEATLLEAHTKMSKKKPEVHRLDDSVIYPPLALINDGDVDTRIPIDNMRGYLGSSHIDNQKYKYKDAFIKERNALSQYRTGYSFKTFAPFELTDSYKNILSDTERVAIWGWNDELYNEMKEYLSQSHKMIFERKKGNVAYFVNENYTGKTKANNYIIEEGFEAMEPEDIVKAGESFGEYLDFIGGKNCNIDG